MYMIIAGLALLLIRTIISITFLAAARNKLSDIDKFAKNNGLSVPAAWVLVSAELLVVISLLAGIFPRLGAMVAMVLMLGSMSFHIFKWKSPYWALEKGWEYDLMIFAMSAVIAVIGAGAFSLFTEPLDLLLLMPWI